MQWLIVDPLALNEPARNLLQELIDTGEFGDEQEVDGIVTYRRLQPAAD